MFGFFENAANEMWNVIAPEKTEGEKFFAAIEAARISDVQNYLQVGGMNPALKNSAGNAPIHVAAYHGHEQIVDLLLSVGADLNALGARHNSVLHYAAMKGHIALVKKFIAAGLSPISRNAQGKSAYDVSSSLPVRQFLMPLMFKEEQRTGVAPVIAGASRDPAVERARLANLPPPPKVGQSMPTFDQQQALLPGQQRQTPPLPGGAQQSSVPVASFNPPIPAQAPSHPFPQTRTQTIPSGFAHAEPQPGPAVPLPSVPPAAAPSPAGPTAFQSHAQPQPTPAAAPSPAGPVAFQVPAQGPSQVGGFAAPTPAPFPMKQPTSMNQTHPLNAAAPPAHPVAGTTPPLNTSATAGARDYNARPKRGYVARPIAENDGFVSTVGNPELSAKYGNKTQSRLTSIGPAKSKDSSSGAPAIPTLSSVPRRSPFAHGRYVNYNARTNSPGVVMGGARPAPRNLMNPNINMFNPGAVAASSNATVTPAPSAPLHPPSAQQQQAAHPATPSQAQQPVFLQETASSPPTYSQWNM